MSNIDFQLGLLFGHLGRSSPKFKAEGLSINISKVALELGMSAQELNTLLLYAEAEGILSVTLVQAVVKLASATLSTSVPAVPEQLTAGAPVHISEVLATHPVAGPEANSQQSGDRSHEETAEVKTQTEKAAKKGGRSE